MYTHCTKLSTEFETSITHVVWCLENNITKFRSSINTPHPVGVCAIRFGQ